MPSFPGPFGPSSPSSDSYLRQLMNLLPPGRLWWLEPGSRLRALLQATADELQRVQERGRNLIDESDPRTAGETMADWERMLSLPDDRVTEIATAIEDRRIAITQKYTSRGGANYDFYAALCGACGYPLISIDKFAALILRAGFRVGDRCYDQIWAYTIRVNVQNPGVGVFALTKPQFERVVRHATHSHITVIFTYT